MTLTEGQRVQLPNGVAVTCEAGHLPGERWRLVHPWAAWAITDAGAVVTLCTVKGKAATRATGWRVDDLRAAAPARMPA